jgi:hypothetical protein
MYDPLNTHDFAYDSKENEVIVVDRSPRLSSDIGPEAVGKRVLADAFYLSDKFVDESPCPDWIVQGDIFADIAQITFNAWSEFQSHSRIWCSGLQRTSRGACEIRARMRPLDACPEQLPAKHFAGIRDRIRWPDRPSHLWTATLWLFPPGPSNTSARNR